jgi:predicted Zn finger-like uncharacterized protein
MKTQCPHCKAKFSTSEQSVGKQAKCPKCVKPFTIESFIETPAKIAESAAPSVKSAVPAAIPAKSAKAVTATSAEPVKVEKSNAKTLSKTVFVYCWIAVRIIAGIFGALGLVLAIRKGANSTLIATFAAADVFLICSVLIEMLLFYKMWAAIQDDQTSVSPAKAVGFLFVPVFNIYWALYMVPGFAEDYNAFIQRRSVKTQDLPLILFLIYAVVFILAATVVTTPMIGVFAFLRLISRAFNAYPLLSWMLLFFVFAAGIGHFITYILFAIKTCNAINALPVASAGKNLAPEGKGR